MKGTKTIPNTGAATAPYNKKNIIIKTFALFADCISEISNIKIIADFPAISNNSVLLKF